MNPYFVIIKNGNHGMDNQFLKSYDNQETNWIFGTWFAMKFDIFPQDVIDHLVHNNGFKLNKIYVLKIEKISLNSNEYKAEERIITI